MRNRNQNPARQTSGSILILGGALFAVLCVAIVVAYSFCGLYFTHNRLQSSADEIALTGAKKLNENDRLGQMNNMVARCRQLVYSSREDYEQTKRDFPDLESFASPLLDESRQSATDMETQRKTLTARVQTEAEAAMQQKFNEIKAGYAMTLPWLSVHSPQLNMTAFGKVDGVESNVTEFTQLEELAKGDRVRNLVATYPSMNLYKAESNYALTGPDANLSFNLSSLPAPVERQAAPARIILEKNYKQTSPGYAPSAAQVVLSLKVDTKIGFSSSSVMKATGISCTTGAAIQL